MQISRCIYVTLTLFFLYSCATIPASDPVEKKTPRPPANTSGTESDKPTVADTPADPERTRFSATSTAVTPDQDGGAALETGSPPLERLPATVGQTAKVPSSQRSTTPESETPENAQVVLDEALDFCRLSQDFWQKGELENALEALDQAYSLILKVDETRATPETLQQKEDLRFMISKRILEIHASRQIVVNGEHNAIPRIVNKHVKAELKLFSSGGEKQFFRDSYRRSGRYRPMILEALREAGLPEELSWLPLIESGYKVNALSKARALGLWQFIPSTGYKFGLSRDKYVDERLDPVKATHAAIAYLKELHQMFGDWATVLAAYNCGEYRVLRVIRSQNVNYLDNFWDLYGRLPRETARYVPRFLATLQMVENPTAYGLDSVVVDAPVQYETVKVSRKVHLKAVAAKIGVSAENLYKLNPELRHKILPNEPYALHVPPGKGSQVLAAIDKIPVYAPPRPSYVYHKVRKGETISTISRRYGVRNRDIARANRLNKRYLIVVGQTLKIPTRPGSKKPRASAKRASRRPAAKAATHTVKQGDSLWIIAQRYGTTTKSIQRLNRLPNTHLKIGQVLKLPAPRSSKLPSKKKLKSYRVRSGDSPFQIARKNNMQLERFLRINHLTPRSKIYPGQILYVE